jgi:hypothetical protein
MQAMGIWCKGWKLIVSSSTVAVVKLIGKAETYSEYACILFPS